MTGIFLPALLVLLPILRYGYKRLFQEDRRPAAGSGTHETSPLETTPQTQSAQAPNSTFWADFATSENVAEKVQVATRSLRLLEKKAKEMRQMAERIIADATNAQWEIQTLIGAPK